MISPELQAVLEAERDAPITLTGLGMWAALTVATVMAPETEVKDKGQLRERSANLQEPFILEVAAAELSCLLVLELPEVLVAVVMEGDIPIIR